MGGAQVDEGLKKAQAAFRDFKKGIGEFHNQLADLDRGEARRMLGMDTLPKAVEEYEKIFEFDRGPGEAGAQGRSVLWRQRFSTGRDTYERRV